MNRTIVEAGGINHRIAMDDDFCEWLASYDVEPKDTYMVVLEHSRMTVFCYKVKDKDGKTTKYVIQDIGHPDYGQAATEVPKVIPYTKDRPVPEEVFELV